MASSIREGALIAGKYRIERTLGTGAMGVVVAARHEQLGQLVAIKFVREDVLENGEAIERFLREARAAVQLRSEHVARVLDIGKLDSGIPFMVMEYLEGVDLSNVLARDGPMSPAVVGGLMLQVCEAVSEAHALGIVHRDLKPQNLFLTQTVGGSPRVKVLDFGVSKTNATSVAEFGSLTRTQTMLGSPFYMAPEQMRSARDVDARVDVWALGVVLYELLTANSPFPADTMPELCVRVAMDPPLPLSQFRADVPAEMAAVIHRCLEKEPAKRYANAAELASALRPFATSALPPIQAAWGSGSASPAPLRPARKTGAIAIAAVATTLLAASALAWHRPHRDAGRHDHATEAPAAPTAEPSPHFASAAETGGSVPIDPASAVAASIRSTLSAAADASARARSIPSSPTAATVAPRVPSTSRGRGSPDDDIPTLR